MTEGLYLRDAYRRSFDAFVSSSAPGEVELSATAFYPTGGGQPSDRGRLVSSEGRSWDVVGVEKGPSGSIRHRIDGELPSTGSAVQGEIDWPLRYAHMRYHTCLHILSGVVFHRFGSGITGGQIYADRARMDLSLPEFGRDTAEGLLADVNRVVREDRPIQVRFLSRAEAANDPTLVRVASELMPDVEEVRLIDIGGFDVQADGGTHVRSTREVGEVSLLKIENKGAKNKRLYVSVPAVVAPP
jgi:misacylated tRNA(Ala) deacylase